jgi:hypothetical protein
MKVYIYKNEQGLWCSDEHGEQLSWGTWGSQPLEEILAHYRSYSDEVRISLDQNGTAKCRVVFE